MSIRRFGAGIAAIGFIAISSPVAAQGPWSFEFRGGVAFPTDEFGGSDLSTGAGFMVTANYRIMRSLAVYGGWTRYRFPANDDVLGVDADIEDTGYAFGLRFVPAFLPALRPWVSAGGVFDHAEMENGASLTADSDHTLGW